MDEANSFHPNIKLVRQVETSSSFFDVFIENKNGILATSVYRKDSTYYHSDLIILDMYLTILLTAL